MTHPPPPDAPNEAAAPDAAPAPDVPADGPPAPPPRPTTLRAYVNERGVDAPLGATVRDVVAAFDAAQGARLADGLVLATDSRGLPVSPDAAAYGGAIYRLIPARRPTAPDAARPADAPDPTA